MNAKFGVFLPFYAFGFEDGNYRSFEKLKELALECERLGYHSIWIDDHLMYADKPLLECWTLLSALAASTRTIRLGTLVLCNQFRNPALLAKMAATLDVISNGRLELGIGAGIQRQEHLAYGYPFPKLKTRAERLSETLEILTQMWTKPKASFQGRHFKVKGAVCQPKPLQKPHPPITIGGCSSPIIKVTAKYADRFDWGPMPLEAYKHKLSLLQANCREINRNPKQIEKACWPQATLYLARDRQEL
ncbi:LLM class flavin-dependent oxidoreductase, partial [Candidatus Bathyarchaeota archaeon]|nr:LLM class flavin-dependent oxidoreductase [Candidatus Bathyarchaeota archaeon]